LQATCRFLCTAFLIRKGPGAGNKPPSVSGDIRLSAQLTGPGHIIPVLRACSGGEGRFIISVRSLLRGVRFIAPARLCRFCALTGTLAPPACAGPPCPVEGGLSSASLRTPSVAHRLLASNHGGRSIIMVSLCYQNNLLVAEGFIRGERPLS
jgi:hypothetical protein